jgi:hypothetical protein
MLKTILSISGRPGLFKLVNQGKNMLIVESLMTGKRTPAYAHDKVISLGDIAIYTTEEDIPLNDVFEAIRVKNEGKQVDVKAIGGDNEIRAYFAEILPDFDDERVYTNDIKKVFSWYNQLVGAGFDSFKSEEPESEKTEE